MQLHSQRIVPIAFSSIRLLLVAALVSQLGGGTILLAQSAQMVAQKTFERPSSTTQGDMPIALARKFKRDAARLALRLEEKKEDLRYQNIIIPQDNIESIYYVLTNIYQNNETAQSIAKCNVHTFPNPSIDHLILIFDREVDWAAPLQAGISETDSDAFNDLLDEYDLIIERHVQWNDTDDAITIRSKAPLNMSALANEFYNIEGIKTIDLGIPKIGGNDINIARMDGGWRVEYVLRFGSYINGKGKMHVWKYQAMDNGQVYFEEESGDPVPEWMRCYFTGDSMVTKS
ncbi:MAG: hypothetical protein AAFW73_13140 [Bacteroidota bacterium]